MMHKSRYFRGSRRRVKKTSQNASSSSNEKSIDASKTENTDLQAVDLSENVRIQRKRPQAIDNTEREQTKRSKKSKRQSSSSKSYVASNDRVQATKKKATKRTNDHDNLVSSTTTGHKRNKQLNRTGSLSFSESDGNFTLSDKSDSLTDTVELCEQSHRKFLQQQIKILKIPFQLETDCSALSRIKANDSKHIPLQVIHNTLRKVNHKTEDEIMRSLNRLAQRKLLDSLHATRSDSSPTAVAEEQVKRHQEVQIRVMNLEKAHDEIRQQHAQHKCIGVLVSQLETISQEFNNKTLIEEIQRTNDLVDVRREVAASDNIPSTHKQLVQLLFKD